MARKKKSRARKNPLILTKERRRLKPPNRRKRAARKLLTARRMARAAHKRLPRAKLLGKKRGKGKRVLTAKSASIVLSGRGRVVRKRARPNPWMRTAEGRELKMWWRKKKTASKFLIKRKKAIARGEKPRDRVGRRTYQQAQLMLSGGGHVIKPKRAHRRPPVESGEVRSNPMGESHGTSMHWAL